MAEQVLTFYPQKPTSRLEQLGLWLRRHRGAIVAVHWLIVVFYSVLVVIPAFLPLPPAQAHI